MVKWSRQKAWSLLISCRHILPYKALVTQRIWPMICLFRWLVLLSADYWICYEDGLPCNACCSMRTESGATRVYRKAVSFGLPNKCLCWREFGIKPGIIIVHCQKQVVVQRIYNVCFSLVSNYYWYFPKKPDSYGGIHYIWSLYKVSITSEAYG